MLELLRMNKQKVMDNTRMKSQVLLKLQLDEKNYRQWLDKINSVVKRKINRISIENSMEYTYIGFKFETIAKTIRFRPLGKKDIRLDELESVIERIYWCIWHISSRLFGSLVAAATAAAR